MRITVKIQLALAMLTFAQFAPGAGGYVPDVYQDEYVTIRAGIPEIGAGPVHIGDALSLVIEARYREGEVVLENLEQEFFTRSFGAQKGISLLEVAGAEQGPAGDGYTVIKRTYRFQVLDCPGDMPSCPGHKTYETPVFTLGYQIIDAAGAVLNNKSIRFRPWPGIINVTQALPVNVERPGEFKDYFPSGGYPPALDAGEPGGGGLWTALFGGLLIVASFAPLLGREAVTGRHDAARTPTSRWEKVLSALERDGTGSDEVWSDQFRRVLTWYCLDELDTNPYAWLNDGPADARVDPHFKALFLDVLNRDGVAAGERQALLDRFRKLSGRGTQREAA